MRINKSGFSLIEILITIGLFAVVISATNVMMYTSMKNARKVTAISLAKAEGAYALKVMQDAVRYAKKVECATDTTIIPNIPYLKTDVVNSSTSYYFYFDPATGQLARKNATPYTAVVPPVVLRYLNSTDVAVSFNGCTNGLLANCAGSGNVSLCFNIKKASGIDVSESSSAAAAGLMFSGFSGNRNE